MALYNLYMGSQLVFSVSYKWSCFLPNGKKTAGGLWGPPTFRKEVPPVPVLDATPKLHGAKDLEANAAMKHAILVDEMMGSTISTLFQVDYGKPRMTRIPKHSIWGLYLYLHE